MITESKNIWSREYHSWSTAANIIQKNFDMITIFKIRYIDENTNSSHNRFRYYDLISHQYVIEFNVDYDFVSRFRNP